MTDLVTRSGREDMTVADRVDLMRADLMAPPFIGVPDRSVTQAIHDIKLTIGHARSTITLYEQAIARGVTEEGLAKGADRMLSDIECLILAWRRGGHREYRRIRAKQAAVLMERRGAPPLGAKIYLPGERRAYVVRARDDRYAVCTKPYFNTVLYFVLDSATGVRGTENLVFGLGAETDEQCLEMLARVSSGETEISHRNRVPADFARVEAPGS